MKKQVLFVCIHNSARSQMAEAFLRKMAGDIFAVESAGLEPGTLNPLVVEVMAEIGIDLAGHGTQGVADLVRQGRSFDYVITVCDEAQAERCPVFPGQGTRLHWGFPDPSSFQGAHQDRLAQTRVVRDMIQTRIRDWLRELV